MTLAGPQSGSAATGTDSGIVCSDLFGSVVFSSVEDSDEGIYFYNKRREKVLIPNNALDHLITFARAAILRRQNKSKPDNLASPETIQFSD